MKPVYIYDSIRTPRGRAKDTGGLHDLKPHDLLKTLYRALEQRNQLQPSVIDEVILGCVTQYGDQAGNIAKTSAAYAGWPSTVGGLTLNRFCSSSVDAISVAALKIGAGQASAIVAGGVEMMSRVPMMSDKASVFLDPEMAAQCQMLMMGSGADLIASLNKVSRKAADAVAYQSQQRAAYAQQQGYFTSIVPVENPVTGATVSEDECIRAGVTLESLAEMPAVFAELGAKGVDKVQLAANSHLAAIDHVHTAGNSPAMADAAVTLLLGDESLGARIGSEPIAKIVASATASEDPLQVLTGCVASAQKILHQQGLTSNEVDLFELHEAFAATVVKCQQDLNISADKLNVNGGVIALGHPMGATGAIMTGTLLDELRRRGLSRGIVAASGAAGAGSALLLECV